LHKAPNRRAFISKKDVIIILILLLSFVATLKTLCLTIYPGDSGELITASYDLSIAHPPGYPLWLLLAKLGSLVIPFGSIAFRSNLVTALFLATTNLFIFLIVFRLTKNLIAGTFASLGFGFSEIVWCQATSSEVYTLNTLLISAVLYFSILFAERKDETFRIFLIIVLLSSLGIANHHTAFLVIPFFLFYLILMQRKILTNKKLMIMSVIIFILGLSVYSYIPIRASVPGISQWHNPETLSGFLNHVTRKVYGDIKQNPFSFRLFGKQASAFFYFLIKEGRLITFILFLTGLYILLGGKNDFLSRRENSLFILALLLSFIACGIGLNLIINTKVNPLKLFLIEVMYIPTLIIMYIVAGLSILITRGIKRTFTKRALGFFYLTIPLFLFGTTYHPCDASRNLISYNYGIDLTLTSDMDSTLIIEGDIQLFPLIYLQRVEGYRKDLKVIDRTGSLGDDIYNYQTMHYKSEDYIESYREGVELKLIRESSSQLYYSQKKKFKSHEYQTIPHGLLYKVVAKEDYAVSPEICLFYRVWSAEKKDVYLDYFSENILSKSYMNTGETFYAAGYPDCGMGFLRQAGELASITKETHNNLGIIYENMGNYDEALKEYKKALITDPENDILFYNIANIYLKRDEFQLAERHFKKAHELNPQRDTYLLALGSIYAAQKKFNDARKSLLKLLRINSDHFEANLLLGDISKRLYLYSESEYFYKKAISLMPENPRSYNNLAGLYLLMKKPAKAITYYKKAYEIGRKYPLPLYNLGVIYYRELNEPERGRYYWEKFLQESMSEELSSKYSAERAKVLKILNTNGFK